MNQYFTNSLNQRRLYFFLILQFYKYLTSSYMFAASILYVKLDIVDICVLNQK